MVKSKGGKGKRASYQTSVVRVPNQVLGQVKGIIDSFHATEGAIEAPGLSQINPEKLTRLYEITQIEDLWDYENLEASSDSKEAREYQMLAEEVNKVIWQVDNSFKGLAIPGYSEDLWGAIELLIRYRLLIRPLGLKPVTAKEFSLWLDAAGIRGNHDDRTVMAVTQGNLQVFASLYEDTQPVDRAQYWAKYYQEHLGKPEVDYWLWLGNPEVLEVCPELTLLLTKLPEPSGRVKLVLEHLGDEIAPFHSPDVSKIPGVWGNIVTVLEGGYFHKSPSLWEQREDYQNAFLDWYQDATDILGSLETQKVIQKCFSCSPERLEDLVNLCAFGENTCWSVLRILPTASRDEIRTAYRAICLKLHPDVNKSPNADCEFRALQEAYELAMSQTRVDLRFR